MKSKQIQTVAVVLTTLFFFSMVFVIKSVEAETSDESEVIITTGNISDYIWSSDGNKLAYVKYLDGQSWGELWVADWNGYEATNPQMIYSEIEVNALEDWQGEWILIRIRQENELPGDYYGRGELWKIRADGTALTQITFTYTDGIRTQWWNTHYNNIGTARWGRFIPGTDLVYFTAHDGNGWWKAYTCLANGTDQWDLISGSTFSFTIGMSPTGNKLLWGTASYYDQPTTLMASNVNGTEVITIKTFTYIASPLVLADGDTVLYNNPNGAIGAIQVNGTTDRVVLDDEYANSCVNYNPVDGQSFLMISNRSSDGNNHIFSIDIDGNNIVQLTEGAYNDDSAMYSPNGDNLLYRRLPVSLFGASYELVIAGAAVVRQAVDPLIPVFIMFAVAAIAGVLYIRHRNAEQVFDGETVDYGSENQDNKEEWVS
jgi:hypothetical protein